MTHYRINEATVELDGDRAYVVYSHDGAPQIDQAALAQRIGRDVVLTFLDVGENGEEVYAVAERIEGVTDDEVRAVMDKAAKAGDAEAVYLCRAALEGRSTARRTIAKIASGSARLARAR